jgi:hypothetical protein
MCHIPVVEGTKKTIEKVGKTIEKVWDATLMNHTFSSLTAQYYHDTTLEMGIMDGPGGLCMVTTNVFAVVVSTTSSDPHATNLVKVHFFRPRKYTYGVHVTKARNHAMSFMDIKYDTQDPTP